jgi:hypothetical protein
MGVDARQSAIIQINRQDAARLSSPKSKSAKKIHREELALMLFTIFALFAAFAVSNPASSGRARGISGRCITFQHVASLWACFSERSSLECLAPCHTISQNVTFKGRFFVTLRQLPQGDGAGILVSWRNRRLLCRPSELWTRRPLYTPSQQVKVLDVFAEKNPGRERFFSGA